MEIPKLNSQNTHIINNNNRYVHSECSKLENQKSTRVSASARTNKYVKQSKKGELKNEQLHTERKEIHLFS